MPFFKRLEDRKKALELKKELFAKFKLGKSQAPVEPDVDIHQNKVEIQKDVYVPAPIDHLYGRAHVGLYLDNDHNPSNPSAGLRSLVDLYLHAAKHRTRHIALLWPATPKLLVLVHALATLERWAIGDKMGIRGLVYPVKTNVFHGLNHIHLDRVAVVEHAQRLLEKPFSQNPEVTRELPSKDAYLYSLNSLRPDQQEHFNPSIGELLPHFLTGPVFVEWNSCANELLSQVGAKLARRAQNRALEINRTIIGDPKTAPDAIFALDGRLNKEEIMKSLLGLRKCGAPEVVMINATRSIRRESKSWRKGLVRFCLMLENAYPEKTPGVVIVTDEPHAVFNLKDELIEQNLKREPAHRWKAADEYSVIGIPSSTGDYGLLSFGIDDGKPPAPRELDISVIDAEAAKVVHAFQRIANHCPSGRNSAQSVIDAANYITRLAAWPCGVADVVDWLESTGANDYTRANYSWLKYVSGLQLFDRAGGAGEYRKALHEAIERGNVLFANYHQATPFALRLAKIIGEAATHQNRQITLIFTGAIYRRLAERFFTRYGDYPGNVPYAAISERIHLVLASQLEDSMEVLEGTSLVFVGLDEEGLRLIVTNDRIPAHSVILLTQRSAQYLRSTLNPIATTFKEFRPFKPRIESILRQLRNLPEEKTILTTGDFVLPAFRMGLTSEVVESEKGQDPEAWRVVLEDGVVILRRPSHSVYIYDPSSKDSTDRGFRSCEVRSLQPGDKLFVMSAELREMVEHVLKEAGVPINHDMTFETALRDYHHQVLNLLGEKWPSGTLIEKVRHLRSGILQEYPQFDGEFPSEQAVRQWINLGKSADTPFEELKPQAPMKEAHFKAFAESLGMSPLEAAYQWQRVIMAVRNSRRVDGRHVSDIYAYMLLQPESAMVQAKMRPQTLKVLFDKARECVVSIDNIIPADERLS